jgi:hypothetical protein
MTIFIPGNVPSSKNSKVWTGRFLVHSKATRKYIKESEKHWKKHAAAFRKELKNQSKPYRIGFRFVRGSKHKFDFINPVQTVQDLMVAYKWIEDDNTDIMVPVPYKYPEDSGYYSYDKKYPGVFIMLP